jgi:hypothetical protein
MAATVGYEDPNNLSHVSCRVVQKAVKRSGFSLYISRISKPALNTVEAACSTKIKTAGLFALLLFHNINFHCTLRLKFQLLYLHKHKMTIFNFFQTHHLKIRQSYYKNTQS